MMRKIIAALALFSLAVGFIGYPNQTVGIVILFAVVVIPPYGVWAKYRMRLLAAAIIQEKEQRLIQKDQHGQIMAVINMEEAYKVSTPYVGFAEAIYRLEQKGQKLEFCTRTAGAKHIVQDVLRLRGEYPPVAPWNSGW